MSEIAKRAAEMAAIPFAERNRLIADAGAKVVDLRDRHRDCNAVRIGHDGRLNYGISEDDCA